ncbi:Polyprotein P3 [Nymphaea thermarum]|nr:Polyprotein P3 [Nymphaea thermarum]
MAQARRISEPEFEGPSFAQPSSMIVNRYKNIARLRHPEVARYWGYHVDEGFSISLEHFSKLGRDMDDLEGTLYNRIQADLENLQEKLQVKLMVCTKCSTKDNYWSDIKDRDFYRHFQISFQTRGYTNWRSGEANLILTRGLTGRLSNTPNMAFAYQINHVTDYLDSHGVTAIPRRRLNINDMQGLNWIIRPSTASIPMQPTEMESTNLIDGRISIRFAEYHSASENEDESQIMEHTILALLNEEEEEEDEMAYYQYLAIQDEEK